MRCVHPVNGPLGHFCTFNRYFQSIQADKFECGLKSFKPASRFGSGILLLLLSLFLKDFQRSF